MFNPRTLLAPQETGGPFPLELLDRYEGGLIFCHLKGELAKE